MPTRSTSTRIGPPLTNLAFEIFFFFSLPCHRTALKPPMDSPQENHQGSLCSRLRLDDCVRFATFFLPFFRSPPNMRPPPRLGIPLTFDTFFLFSFQASLPPPLSTRCTAAIFPGRFVPITTTFHEPETACLFLTTSHPPFFFPRRFPKAPALPF